MATLLVGVSTGGTTADNITAGDNSANKYTAVATGSGAVIWAHTKVANPGFTDFQMGVYADAAGLPGARLAWAVADSLAAARGTSPFSATFVTPATITSGTAYWLVWYSAGELFDYQGDVLGSYYQTVGVPPDPYGTPGSGPFTFQPIIWVETATPPTTNIDMGGYGPAGMS